MSVAGVLLICRREAVHADCRGCKLVQADVRQGGTSQPGDALLARGRGDGLFLPADRDGTLIEALFLFSCASLDPMR
jgi:hypothetical protein